MSSPVVVQEWGFVGVVQLYRLSLVILRLSPCRVPLGLVGDMTYV
jgi:hypothetical protein